MPRNQWIFKFSAQNTIVVSRTFFTQEVNEAFEELEEGEWWHSPYQERQHTHARACKNAHAFL